MRTFQKLFINHYLLTISWIDFSNENFWKDYPSINDYNAVNIITNPPPGASLNSWVESPSIVNSSFV